MKKIRVLLVEDDPFWHEQLAADLDREEDIEIAGVARTGDEAISICVNKSVDIVLMDINLTENNLDGLDATRQICKHCGCQIKIIMLTSLTDREIILKSFQNGAVNFINKSSYNDILNAIREAYEEKISIHCDAAEVMRNEIHLMSLTPMEREVYDLKQQGLSHTEIGELLHKSVNTIKTQWKSIKKKLMGD